MSEDAKHTPGPWKPVRNGEGFFGPEYYLDDDERDEFDASPYVGVAHMHGRVVSSHDLFQLNHADALLIAAAPDLLEACRKAILAIAHANEKTPGLYQDAYDSLDAAIAKATSGEP